MTNVLWVFLQDIGSIPITSTTLFRRLHFPVLLRVKTIELVCDACGKNFSVRAFKIIQDDVSSKKLVAKRDAYLVATKGDVATAQKIWAVENPNKPWPA